jgi:hypothetical protein
MRYDGIAYVLRRSYLCVVTVLPMCCDGSGNILYLEG